LLLARRAPLRAQLLAIVVHHHTSLDRIQALRCLGRGPGARVHRLPVERLLERAAVVVGQVRATEAAGSGQRQRSQHQEGGREGLVHGLPLLPAASAGTLARSSGITLPSLRATYIRLARAWPQRGSR